MADELKVADDDAALQGARDILAERFNDDADARAAIRELFLSRSVIKSEVLPGKERRGSSSRTITTGPSRCPMPRRTACWRSGAGRRRDSCPSRSARQEEDAMAILENASSPVAARPPSRFAWR